MSPWPVIGHEWATDLLAQAVRSGRPSHAYLFTGPSQVGKTTLARAFGQAFVCERSERGDGAPCGGSADPCRTCQRVAQRRYPDVQYITAEKNTIQIEQVRVLQTDAAIAPLEGRRRVFIVREIERATAAGGQCAAEDAGGAAIQGDRAPDSGAPRPGAAHHPLALPDRRAAAAAD